MTDPSNLIAIVQKRLRFSEAVENICVADGVVCFTSGVRLFLWFASSDDSSSDDAGDETSWFESIAELPFLPAVLCAFERRLFVGCADSFLVLAIDDDGAAAESFFVPPGDASLFSRITCGVWAPDGSAVAVTSGPNVILVATERDCDLTTLSCEQWYGPDGATNLLAFGSAATLFVVSRGNHLLRFDACDLAEPRMARDGHIVCAATSATCLAADPRNNHVFVGTSDGLLRVFAYDSLRAVTTVAVAAAFTRALTVPIEEQGDATVDTSNVQLGVHSVSIAGSDVLLVATAAGTVGVSRAALAVGHPQCFGALAGVVVGAGGLIGAWFPFAGELRLEQLRTAVAVATVNAERDAANNMVFARQPLPASLTAPLLVGSSAAAAPAAAAASSKGAAKPKPKSAAAVPKPVTFGRPIKSSGYTNAVPWSVQQAAKAKAKQQAAARARAPPPELPRFDCAAPPPTQELAKANAVLAAPGGAVHRAVVCAMTFDATGNFLVSGSGDTTLHMLKCPVARNAGDGICARGHTSAVQSVDVALSMQHPLVATGSFDGTVALWRPTRREAPYVMHATGKEVSAVRFFAMDRLLCVASGGAVTLHRFGVDEGGGDLDRARNESRLAAAHVIQTGAQQVAAIDCFNSFASNLVLWAGSNKRIGIYDAAAMAEVRGIADAHARAIHSLALPRGTRFCGDSGAVSPDDLHCFATAGLDRAVRIWDMRQASPVRQLSAHANTAVRVGLGFSPCTRFVAVGSEDRSAVLYDRASGVVAAKLPTPDVVTALAFHPLESVLALGCSNGDVRMFGSPK